MNWKKFISAFIVVFLIFYFSDWIIHAMILAGAYAPMVESGVIRSDEAMAQYWWVMIITHLVFAFFFTFIFVKGYEGKGIAEGIRYGIYIGFLWVFYNAYTNFTVYTIQYSIVWPWIIFGFIQTILMGIAATLIYKPKAA